MRMRGTGRGAWTLEKSAQIELTGRGLKALAGWVVAALIVTGLLAALLAMADVAVGLRALAAIAAGSLVVVLVGECALCLARIDRIAARPLMSVVIGASVTSLVLVAGVVFSGRTAGAAFLCWGLLVLAVAFVLRKRLAASQTSSGVDLFVMGAVALIIALGCSVSAQAVPALEATGYLPVWIDAYIHGTVIANFGDPVAAGRGDILMSGGPLFFYHYGYYQLAAAVMGAVATSGLVMATAVLLPLGLFLGAISVYALASEMADRRAGVLALALLTIVPDASHYGLANGFFGFHWLLFTNPGSGYGLGACAAVLAMLVAWLRSANVRALVLAALLMVAVFQLRAHFFLWLVPAAVGTLILATPLARRHAGALWSLGLLGLAALIAALLAIAPLQQVWLAYSVVVDYVHVVHAGQEPTAYTGLYEGLVAALGPPAAALVGILLIVPAMLGVFVVAYPAALLLVVRARGWQPIDALPLLLLIVFALITLFAPAVPWGDITEYQHRAFVLAYMVIVVWTAVYVVQLLPAGATSPIWIAAGSAAVAAGAAALVGLAGINPAAPRFHWAKDYYNLPVTSGIAASAREIRRNAKAGDIVAIGPVLTDRDLDEPATKITSLTGVPTLLARYKIQVFVSDEARQMAKRRLDILRKVEAESDLTKAVELLRAEGVTWYVWVGGTGPRFDRSRGKASLIAGDTALYRLDEVAPDAGAGSPGP